MKLMKNIAVLGSGAWGTALGNLIAKNGFNVKIWGITPSVISEINKHHTNKKYLPKARLNKRLSASQDLREVVSGSELIYIVVPSKAVRVVLKEVKKILKKDSKIPFIICSKGIEEKSQKFMSQVFEDVFGKQNTNLAVLTGPNFAKEIITGTTPTVTTIATKHKTIFNKIQRVMDCSTFRTYFSRDVVGAQICGTVKNVIAIACGISKGLGWGLNARAAFITQGAKEMGQICRAFGSDGKIISQPAGIGDLVLTCNSTKSRNMTMGYKLGKGVKLSDVLKLKHLTFEGHISVKSAVRIGRKYNLSLPLCMAVDKILSTELPVKRVKEVLREEVISGQ